MRPNQSASTERLEANGTDRPFSVNPFFDHGLQSEARSQRD